MAYGGTDKSIKTYEAFIVRKREICRDGKRNTHKGNILFKT